LDIAGKPMLYHTWQSALQCGADEVIIATDDKRIFDVMSGLGADVCMTREDHATGTDRIAEVAKQKAWADDVIVVNLQGDEPLTPTSLLVQVAADLDAYSDASMATLATPVQDIKDSQNTNVVKLVTDKKGYALYFSRATIPWYRDAFAISTQQLPELHQFRRHLGIYAYRVGFLHQYGDLQSAPIEEAESLEQLRVLWHGYRIHVSDTETVPGHGVDTEEDLLRIRQMLA
jgi:3-deoxy-manno-octulosonate cytidylyltransferase (CMP-KDO synthetase)